MKNELISIVVPAYNIAPYIAQCLDSILAQTNPEIEIIAVNDGSTDKTPAILNAYAQKDDRIRVIHKDNGGVTSARLRGITEATGKWIGFVDGDDSIEPEMYERLLSNAIDHQADISHCGYQMVFPDGRSDLYHGTGRLVQQNKTTGLRDLLTGSFVEPGLWNKLFRKSLFPPLLDGGWMDTSIKINEDLLMNYYLFRESNGSVFQDCCWYRYQARKGSASKSSLNFHQLRDPMKVTKVLLYETKSEAALHNCVEVRWIRQLITLSTMTLGNERALVSPHRKNARKELRATLPHILSKSACGKKLKCMALWAGIAPATYGWVHRVYAKVTGVDKKYSVD